MKTTSVTTHYERKLNTGDYSSVTLSAWATVELEEGDLPENGLAYGMEQCRAAVKAAAAPFVKTGVPVTVEEKFQGKRIRTESASGPGILLSNES